MAHAVYKDRVKETTRTQGTSTYSLAGAENGFQGFSAVGAGNACYYCCEDGTSWEIGSGYYTTGFLTRFPIVTSNSNALVSWGGGTRSIYLVLPASQIGAVDGSSALDDLSDVVSSSPSFRQRLTYNGSTWIPSGIFAGDIPSGLSVGILTSGTVTNDEFGRLAGVTSAIQTQLDSKAASAHSHTVDGLSDAVVTSAAIRQRLAFDGTNWVNSGLFIVDLPSGITAEMISNGVVNNTEFGYLDGVTSAIQTQFTGKSDTSHSHTVDGLSDAVITSAVLRQRLAFDGTNWVNSGLFVADVPSGITADMIGAGAVSNAEFGYLDGVTSALQTQLDGKSATGHTHTLDNLSDAVIISASIRQRLTYDGSNWINSGIFYSDLPSGLPVAMITSGTVTNDEFGRLAGVTSAIQTQFTGKSDTSHSHTVDGLSDAVITSASFRERLAYNGTNWINSGTYSADVGSGTASPSKALMGDMGFGMPTGPLITAPDGATITFNLSDSSLFNTILGGNRTLAIQSGVLGQRFFTRITQDNTGSRTVTWFTGANWGSAGAPTLTTTANKADWFGFINISGTTYDGFNMGASY